MYIHTHHKTFTLKEGVDKDYFLDLVYDFIKSINLTESINIAEKIHSVIMEEYPNMSCFIYDITLCFKIPWERLPERYHRDKSGIFMGFQENIFAVVCICNKNKENPLLKKDYSFLYTLFPQKSIYRNLKHYLVKIV